MSPEALPSTPQTLAVESLVALRQIYEDRCRKPASASLIRLAALDALNAERHYRATMDPQHPEHWQYVK